MRLRSALLSSGSTCEKRIDRDKLRQLLQETSINKNDRMLLVSARLLFNQVRSDEDDIYLL